MSPRKKSSRKFTRPGVKKQLNTKSKESGFFDSAFKKNFNLSAVLLICIIGFFAYSNTFYAEMQFDDGLHIVRKDIANNLSDFTSFSEWTNFNKRPLSNFSFALNYYFGGYDVFGYHIFNLFIHLFSAVLVFILARKIFASTFKTTLSSSADYKNIVPLFTALLFVAHPIQTEAVTYIVQRMTSQSAMFYLLAILLYAIGRAHHISGDKRKAVLFYLLTFISAISALLSKQIAATIPFALLLYEFFFVKNKDGKIFKNYILISLSILASGVVYVLFSGLLPTETENIGRYEYLITQSRVVVKYFQLLIFPVQQNLDYSFSLSESIWGWKEMLSIFFLLGILGLAIKLIKKRPVTSFGIFWIFLTLSVESSFIPIRDLIFEHRLYLPMFGFTLIVTDLAFHFFGRRKIKPAIIILGTLVFLLSISTYNRNKVWRTQYLLWLDTMEKSPDKTRPLYNLAFLYSADGRQSDAIKYAEKAIELDSLDGHAYFVAAICNERAGNIEQAIKHYKKGIEIDEDNSESVNNLGNIYLKNGNYKEAEKYFALALNDSKKQTAVLKNLVIVYYKLKDYKNTIEYAKIYLRKEPGDVTVLSKLGDSYLYLKQNERAIKTYKKVIKIDPKRASTYNNLGTCYYYKADYEKAAQYYLETLKIDPTNKNAKQFLSLTQKFLEE